MTYDATESGQFTGNPVELYKFTLGTLKYRYTSDTVVHTYNSELYTPLTISRSEIEQTEVLNRTNLKIHMPRDTAVAELFKAYSPGEVVTVQVFRYHPDDGNFALIWTGRVIAPEWSGVKATLNCEPITTALKRNGLRRGYQAQCPHVLYGVDCGVNQLTYRTTDVVTTIDGVTLEVGAASAFANDYFSGGFAQWFDSDGVQQTRFISDHAGSTITLSAKFQGISVSDTVNLFPGCKHVMTDCDGKFNNSENYGGFAHVPDHTPFGGAVVF